ncbi:MAG: GNAT family N-acetyltransferase [Lachnospiraceae bacterium]|nr:GNAT family N-acetyltransferase [Lachnospiraceae bacterium]MDE6186201.1 GNAT family N-acetyltransferase [Lachnospiraceae bacterium]
MKLEAKEAEDRTQAKEIQIRTARVQDAEKLLEIYTPYVEKTAITFEYEVPDVKEFTRRIKNTLERYPYLIACQEGEVFGYAYTGPFVGRAAYGWAAEVSIYLKEDKRGKGIGRKLYGAVEAISKAQHILNLNACIGYPEAEDAYLTKNSVQFHAHMGYSMVGEFHKCGYKFGNWYNMVWMEKEIGAHDAHPAPVIAFPDLDAEIVKKCTVLDSYSLPGSFLPSVP